MLNELLLVEEGVRGAAIETVPLHRDVNPDPTESVPVLHVRLNAGGEVASIRPLPQEAKPWTLQDGQHNRFPFVQPKPPLWNVSSEDDAKRLVATNPRDKLDKRRDALLALAQSQVVDKDSFKQWPTEGFLARLRERHQQLGSLVSSDSAVVPAVFERFLGACNSTGGPLRLLRSIEAHLLRELEQTAETAWVNVAAALLLGKFDKKKNFWKCAGALLFDGDAAVPIYDNRLAPAVSRALDEFEHAGAAGSKVGICALTGCEVVLLFDSFDQCNLPVIGQTYLFSRNVDIRANDRYGRFSSATMPAGKDTVARLKSALLALTSDERSGKTWRKIPAEASKQNDLLLAFVAAAPDAPIAGALAGDEDLSAEDARTAPDTTGESTAVFEKRTQRIIEAVSARVGTDFRRTPVHLVVLHKIDKGNSKVVYSGTPTVGELYDAANEWTQGERNVPAWITIPVFTKGKVINAKPPHIAPLDVIGFSKQLFVRQGEDRREVAGLPASEALALFFDTRKTNGHGGQQRIKRVLRLVLARRAALIVRGVQILRVAGYEARPVSVQKPKEQRKDFDRHEALRTLTLLGVLLIKIGRTKEVFMNDTAFKLGQLLAAADAVHLGYCADVRGGSVPPSLLGNQLFTMAQAAPTKALALLSRRWKPYAGWASKAAREQDAASLVNSEDKRKQQRGWDIRVALRYAREMAPLADALKSALESCVADDRFRAELLLGYIAGLPKGSSDERGDHRDEGKTAESAAERK